MAPDDDVPGEPDELDAALAELEDLDDEEIAEALEDLLDDLEDDGDEDDIEVLDAAELRLLADKLDELKALDLEAQGIVLANVIVEVTDGVLSVLVAFDEGETYVLPNEVTRLD
ncbi:MAG: hypothetical protein IPM45_03140 [Acidimicrobiales bacterium]|nr:hypothetical protein [Acidimicrobiales bacterium]